MKTFTSALKILAVGLALATLQIDADGCITPEPVQDDACCRHDAGHPADAPDSRHGCEGGLASCCHPLLATTVAARADLPAPAASSRPGADTEVPPAGLGADLFRPPILPA